MPLLIRTTTGYLREILLFADTVETASFSQSYLNLRVEREKWAGVIVATPIAFALIQGSWVMIGLALAFATNCPYIVNSP